MTVPGVFGGIRAIPVAVLCGQRSISKCPRVREIDTRTSSEEGPTWRARTAKALPRDDTLTGMAAGEHRQSSTIRGPPPAAVSRRFNMAAKTRSSRTKPTRASIWRVRSSPLSVSICPTQCSIDSIAVLRPGARACIGRSEVETPLNAETEAPRSSRIAFKRRLRLLNSRRRSPMTSSLRHRSLSHPAVTAMT